MYTYTRTQRYLDLYRYMYMDKYLDLARELKKTVK